MNAIEKKIMLVNEIEWNSITLFQHLLIFLKFIEISLKKSKINCKQIN